MALRTSKLKIKLSETPKAVRDNAPTEPVRSRHDAALRSEAIFLDHQGAANDPEFKKLAAAADRGRDLRDWAKAEFDYWKALERYPFHSGYRIQYAHVIKEQGKYDWAEVHYRSALAEGAAMDLIDEHLRFAVLRNGAAFVSPGTFNLEVQPFAAPPTFHDLKTLSWLFWSEVEVNSFDALKFLRECRTNREVALRMVEDRRFIEKNRQFLEILGS